MADPFDGCTCKKLRNLIVQLLDTYTAVARCYRAKTELTADALNHAATWNAAMLLSADLPEAMTAAREKRAPKFRD